MIITVDSERAAIAANQVAPRAGSPYVRRTAKVSDVIAREILSELRGLPPFSRLPPESAMLAKYQVGRASLREALRVLEVFGLIVIRPGPGGGPLVAPIESHNLARMLALYLDVSEATYSEVLEARIALEPVAARLAAESQDPETLSKLEEFLRLKAPDDEPEYILHSGDFHRMLTGMSGNRVLGLLGRSVQDVYVGRIEGTVFPVEARSRIVRDHQAIAKAILSGKPARAEVLMRSHMEEFLAFSAELNPGVLAEVVTW